MPFSNPAHVEAARKLQNSTAYMLRLSSVKLKAAGQIKRCRCGRPIMKKFTMSAPHGTDSQREDFTAVPHQNDGSHTSESERKQEASLGDMTKWESKHHRKVRSSSSLPDMDELKEGLEGREFAGLLCDECYRNEEYSSMTQNDHNLYSHDHNPNFMRETLSFPPDKTMLVPSLNMEEIGIATTESDGGKDSGGRPPIHVTLTPKSPGENNNNNNSNNSKILPLTPQSQQGIRPPTPPSILKNSSSKKSFEFDGSSQTSLPSPLGGHQDSLTPQFSSLSRAATPTFGADNHHVDPSSLDVPWTGRTQHQVVTDGQRDVYGANGLFGVKQVTGLSDDVMLQLSDDSEDEFMHLLAVVDIKSRETCDSSNSNQNKSSSNDELDLEVAETETLTSDDDMIPLTDSMEKNKDEMGNEKEREEGGASPDDGEHDLVPHYSLDTVPTDELRADQEKLSFAEYSSNECQHEKTQSKPLMMEGEYRDDIVDSDLKLNESKDCLDSQREGGAQYDIMERKDDNNWNHHSSNEKVEEEDDTIPGVSESLSDLSTTPVKHFRPDDRSIVRKTSARKPHGATAGECPPDCGGSEVAQQTWLLAWTTTCHALGVYDNLPTMD